MHHKVSSTKWWPFCPGEDELVLNWCNYAELHTHYVTGIIHWLDVAYLPIVLINTVLLFYRRWCFYPNVNCVIFTGSRPWDSQCSKHVPFSATHTFLILSRSRNKGWKCCDFYWESWRNRLHSPDCGFNNLDIIVCTHHFKYGNRKHRNRPWLTDQWARDIEHWQYEHNHHGLETLCWSDFSSWFRHNHLRLICATRLGSSSGAHRCIYLYRSASVHGEPGWWYPFLCHFPDRCLP